MPFSIHHSTSGTAIDISRALFTSPVVILIAHHFYERWVYSAIFEAVESFIIRPDNADIESPDALSKDRATSILGLQRRSPPLVRSAINKLLMFLGWCEPDVVPGTSLAPSVANAEQDVEVAGTRITDLAPIEIPVSQTDHRWRQRQHRHCAHRLPGRLDASYNTANTDHI
jgi:hypothetical protein